RFDFFFQAEDGIRDRTVTGVQTCALPILIERAYNYLQQQLAEPAPQDDGWWPAYTAWQAFAVKVLVEGGRNQDSNINRLYQRLRSEERRVGKEGRTRWRTYYLIK